MGYIITINREYGSGGKQIGKAIATELGISFYDRELISLVSDDSAYIEPDEQMKYFLNSEDTIVSDDRTFVNQSKIIRDLAAKEDCVIVGRCADYILRDFDNVIKIFIHADKRNCLKRVMRLYKLNPDEAKMVIASKNKNRAKYYNYYTNREWTNAENYDLSVNSSVFGEERTAELLVDYIRMREKEINKKQN